MNIPAQLIIGSFIYNNLLEKEQEKFRFYKRYNNLNISEWFGDNYFYDEDDKYHRNIDHFDPYDVAIIPMINKNDTNALEKANKINLELLKNDIDAVIDDTDENFSSKIKKMNLIGAPYQIIIGKQTDGDLLEFKEVGKDSQKLKLKDIINLIIEQKAKN